MLTRKQADCFYREWKNGNLKRFNDHLIGLMYEESDFPTYAKSKLEQDFRFSKLNDAMTALFNKEFEKAEEDMFAFLTNGKWVSLNEYLEVSAK